MKTIFDHLNGNSYPGRGILIGKAEGGAQAAIAYFIMGRSPNSRNRVFTPKEGGIITEAADPAKLEDPSLIIYAPVRVLGNDTIVTNGDQTDTIFDALQAGHCMRHALKKRRYEPDEPNCTPRISGLVTVEDGKLSYDLSILKADNGRCQRHFFEYEDADPGVGRFLSTYQHDGSPLPSFAGEPVEVAIAGNVDSFAQRLWDSLDRDNRVSLFVRYIDLKDGGTEDVILNQYEKA